MEGGRALLAALLLALTYVPASQAQVAVVDSAPALGRRLAAGDGSGGAAATGARCPPLSKELLQRRAKNNTVMLAVMNVAQVWGHAWFGDAARHVENRCRAVPARLLAAPVARPTAAAAAALCAAVGLWAQLAAPHQGCGD